MKFVAYHVRIPSLIAKATATAGASPELESNAIALSGGGGFGITASDYQCPDRLYVKKDSSIVVLGSPYEILEYHHFQDLKSIPSGERLGIMDPATFDERPNLSYTITPDSKLWAQPLTVSNVLSFYYRKTPAAYSGSATPEITPFFDYLLVNGAVVALKEFLREPAEIVTMWTLFESALAQDVQRYDNWLNGGRKRGHLKIHRSYRIT